MPTLPSPLKKHPLHFNGKYFVLTTIIMFLGIQIFEAFSWREDFPFTKWGMYYAHPSFSPNIGVFIEVNEKKMTLKHFKSPWVIRRKLWSILELGNPHEKLKHDTEYYLEKVTSLSKEKKVEIESLLKSDINNKLLLKSTKVVFRTWDKLSHESIHTPKNEYIVYSGNK